LIRLLFRRPQSTVLVQNPDDRAALAAHGVPEDQIALIPGSGVDMDRYQPLPEPDGPITAAYVGRLLADKGLHALIDAHQRLGEGAVTVRLLLAGTPDPSNPALIPEATLAAWRQLPGVELLGHVNDIRTVWARAQIAVLPSRREGLPLSLLEAAACGRPLVATDVPGCREIARDGVNATLVPVDDGAALAAALADMANDAEKRKRYGIASRALVEAEFSARRIGTDIVALYRRLLDAATGRGG
jgi:glycosyltransferase involved in cell wall biosynthesis